MYFVYILKSLKDNGFYTGMTNDLEKRIKRHNSGLVTSTKSRIPFVLLHYETVADSKEARQREKYFKSGIGRDLIKKMFS
jgi:putative endonuclease